MLNVVCVVVLIFALVTPTVSQPSTCMKDKGNSTDLAECANLTGFDVAVVFDHSVYVPNKTAEDDDVKIMYERLVENIFELIKRNLPAVRKTFLRTDWNAPYFVVIQKYIDIDDVNNLKWPYQFNESIPTNKTGLGETLQALYEEDVRNGRRDKVKVAIVMTRGTISTEDANVIKEMNNLMMAGYKIYIFLPVPSYEGQEYLPAAKLSDIFANQSSEPLDNWEVMTFHKYQMYKKGGDVPYRLVPCMCAFVTMCESVECGYRRNNTVDGDMCVSTNKACPPYCTKAKCEQDCELKGWTEWSKCERGKKVRKRLNESAGNSEFTTSCAENMTANCDENELSKSAEVPTKFGDTKSSGIHETRPMSEFSPKDAEVGRFKQTESSQATVWIVVGCCLLILVVVAAIVTIIVVRYRRRKGKKKSASGKDAASKHRRKDSNSAFSAGHYEKISDIQKSAKRNSSLIQRSKTSPEAKKDKSQIYMMM